MGNSGSSSRNSSTIDTSIAVNALSKAVMNCASNVLVEQKFQISGNYNVMENIKQVQAVQFSSTCKQTAQQTSSLQQSIGNAIQQAASAQSASILSVLGGSKSDIDTMISSNVKQNITQESIQNIVNSCSAQQSIIISGDNNIVKSFEQSSTIAIVQDACQNFISSLSSVQTINNALASKAEAVSNNPVSQILDSVFSGLTSLSSVYMIVAVVAMAVGGYIMVQWGPGVFLKMAGLGDDDDDDSEGNEQPVPMQQMSMQPVPVQQMSMQPVSMQPVPVQQIPTQ